MKHLWLLAFMFFIPDIVSAQSKRFNDVSELSAYLDEQHADSLQKITAAYRWVTTNIRYNTRGAYAMNNHPDPRNLIDKAFQNRAGVCENFAAIFSDLCQKMGFRTVVIHGYTHQSSGANNSGHSWVGVYLQDDWYLFDPTWDVGKSTGFKYFMKTGVEFSNSHIPFDFLWQMQEHPATGRRKNLSLFNYKDSIAAYFASDSVLRLQSSIRRINQIEEKNELTKTHLEVLKTHLEIAHQDDQMVWYELAVSNLNEAIEMLNEVIDLRNNSVSGKLEKVVRILSEMEIRLNDSQMLLERVDQSEAILVYGTGPARDQLNWLRQRHQEQARYFAHAALITEEK